MIYPCIEQAANFMATGNLFKAATVLDHAIQGLKDYFHVQEARLATTGLDTTSSMAGVVSSVDVILGPSVEAASSKPFNEYPIFKRALLIRVVETSAWSSELNVAKVTAVVLYNKGLICHLLGEGDEKTPSQAALTSKARVLYQKALELINACSPSERDEFWLKSILLYNLGQISSYNCDRCAEQIYLTEMEKLIRQRHDQDAFDGNESELILTLVLLFGAHRPAPAA